MPLLPSSDLFDPFESSEAPVLTTAYPTHALPEEGKMGRREEERTYQHNGEWIKLHVRDKLSSEDWLLSAARATAYALKRGQEYRGTPPAREIRDALLKTDTVI